MTTDERDTQLLTQWRNDNGRAGSVLLARHFRSLRRFFANKARGHEDDLVQQVFVACVEDRDAFRGSGSFRAYLFGLAQHTLMDHYRIVYRQQRFNFTGRQPCDMERSAAAPVNGHEEHEFLALVLRNLPADQQTALQLMYWDERTAPEVAQMLGISVNTVYSRLRRAKAHLREAVEHL
jgi:RNA polymerase sigma-70 factor (ECF subfamily)